jgi:hypothetical protein
MKVGQTKSCIAVTVVVTILSCVGYASNMSPDGDEAVLSLLACAVDTSTPIGIEIAPLVQAPSDPTLWSMWRQELTKEREEVRNNLEYDDRLYRRSDLAWVRSCYSCCFAMGPQA